MKVSVIIPTLNAGELFEELLTRLEGQTLPPEEIIVVDSGSRDGTVETAKKHDSVRLMRTDCFNHGGTRDMAAREAEGDLLLFMTQDAVPASDCLIQILVEALEKHPDAAAAYARQLPREDAREAEKHVRAFSYPDSSEVHNLDSVQTLGLRAFYLSNVCAAYRRDIFLRLDGFERDLRSNEDMLFAAKAIRAGYEIVYEAQAQVIHSHDLTLSEQYRRNRLQGYELARHRGLLGKDSPMGSGRRMLAFVSRKLLGRGRLISLAGFCLDCVARYAGNRAGKRAFERERK